MAPNVATSPFRGLSGHSPSTQYLLAKGTTLAAVVETSSEYVLDPEGSRDDISSPARLPVTPDDIEPQCVLDSQSSEPENADPSLLNSHMDSTIVDSSKRCCVVQALPVSGRSETSKGLPSDGQLSTLPQISTMEQECENPLTESIVEEHLNENRVIEHRIRPNLNLPDEQKSPGWQFEDLVNNDLNEYHGAATILIDRGSFQNNFCPNNWLAAAEKVVIETVSLYKNDSPMDFFPQRVAEEQISADRIQSIAKPSATLSTY